MELLDSNQNRIFGYIVDLNKKPTTNNTIKQLHNNI